MTMREKIAEIITLKAYKRTGVSLIAVSNPVEVADAILEILPVMEWQPIETAPKDGTWIMLFSPCEEFPTSDVTHWIAKYGYFDNSFEPGWIDQEDALVMKEHEPTHWMPLPPPPADMKEEGQ